jgi:hypothetical protein
MILTEEILLLQKRAGIITESEYKEKMAEAEEATKVSPEEEQQLQKDAKAGLADAADELDQIFSGVKPSPKDKELKEIEPITLTASILLSAPGMMKGLGWIARKIAKPFQDDKRKTPAIAKWLAHWGHEWEKQYIIGIAKGLQLAFPDHYSSLDPKDEKGELYLQAKKVFQGILIGAAVVSGAGALEADKLVTAAIEGGMTGIKGGEVAILGKEIAKAAGTAAA